jgi:hypothetical protein
MAESDSRGMIRTSLHLPYRPKALNLTLPVERISPMPTTPDLDDDEREELAAVASLPKRGAYAQ